MTFFTTCPLCILAVMPCIAGLLGACGGGAGPAPAAHTVGMPAAQAPASPLAFTLTAQTIKTLRFSWTDVSGETEYLLLESADGVSAYSVVKTLPPDTTQTELEVFLPARVNALYTLRACNAQGCTATPPVGAGSSLREAIGYIKSSRVQDFQTFGTSVALSGDGRTLVVGAPQDSEVEVFSGAVYVYARSDQGWVLEQRLKAPNPGSGDLFGFGVALSHDGQLLAVGAPSEASAATGVDPAGGQTDDAAPASGAVYLFSRAGGTWTQQHYLKASNTGQDDQFGHSVALAFSPDDGWTLAVGAPYEDSSATGINNGESLDDIPNAGAVYVFTGTGGTWAQQAYVKASNIGLSGDRFGWSLDLSANGDTLAIGAPLESRDASGVEGDPLSGPGGHSGAVYVFTRSNGQWSQQAYAKADNLGQGDRFGWQVALAADGQALAIGAPRENSDAQGINPVPYEAAGVSGAAYVFTRSGQLWTQQVFIKASNAKSAAFFGHSIALSADGQLLAVGAPQEDGVAVGLEGTYTPHANGDFFGAAYVFERRGGAWQQQAYVKPTHADPGDFFGAAVALAADGSALAVGVSHEASGATGINGDRDDNTQPASGSVYLY